MPNTLPTRAGPGRGPPHPPPPRVSPAQPPAPRWPGGARLALNFVVNYEEGGERSVLHGDKVAETRLADLLVPGPLQGARDLNMESAYEYGSRVGFWRLMRVFAERQVIPTIYAVG